VRVVRRTIPRTAEQADYEDRLFRVHRGEVFIQQPTAMLLVESRCANEGRPRYRECGNLLARTWDTSAGKLVVPHYWRRKYVEGEVARRRSDPSYAWFEELTIPSEWHAEGWCVQLLDDPPPDGRPLIVRCPRHGPVTLERSDVLQKVQEAQSRGATVQHRVFVKR
jgi:hypothetical protein